MHCLKGIRWWRNIVSEDSVRLFGAWKTIRRLATYYSHKAAPTAHCTKQFTKSFDRWQGHFLENALELYIYARYVPSAAHNFFHDAIESKTMFGLSAARRVTSNSKLKTKRTKNLVNFHRRSTWVRVKMLENRHFMCLVNEKKKKYLERDSGKYPSEERLSWAQLAYAGI